MLPVQSCSLSQLNSSGIWGSSIVSQPRNKSRCAGRAQQRATSAFWNQLLGRKDERALAKDTLLEAISESERGLQSRDSVSRAPIMAAISVLEQLGKDSVTTDAKLLTATWRLLWTTEKETLFILQNAGWFKTEAGDVYQVIDVDRGTLNNVITFPPDGAFVVDASIDVSSAQRVDFSFTKAELQTAERTLTLPPFGKGWFENVYVDDNLRVAKDSRGDWLVVERAKLNWTG